MEIFMDISEKLSRDFWEEDKENGSIIKNQYDEIKEILSEYDNLWVKDQLRRIKYHAVHNTEFYKNYKVDDDFPVVNKNIIIDNYNSMLATSGFDYPTHVSSTSGSTGIPFKVVQDMRKRKRTIADLKVMGELAEYKTHEKMVFFRGLHGKLRSPEQENKENIYYIDCADLSPDGLNKMYCEITEKRPVCLLSYASTLVELAKYIVSEKLEKLNLKSVITIGEGISEENRKLLSDVFNCKVYRRYSDMELGILAQDNGNGGDYILNYGSYYFECLKIDSDKPANDGEIGRIIVTDLFNLAQPMIRYDTGDLGIMQTLKSGEKVLKEIYGRMRDAVYSVSGTIISPAKISVSMWGVSGIKQWQFIQKSRSEYTLKLNADINKDYSEVINTLKAVLGENAEINVEFVNDIPVLSSNKRRAIVCEWKP